MVSHDFDQVRRLADRVTVLDRRVVAEGDRGRRAGPGVPRVEELPIAMTAFYAWIGDLAQRGILPSDFQYPFLIRGFLCVLVLAPILGGLSHLVVTRRMAFFSAALGQAALTGVAIGLLLGEPLNAPYGGMFGFCLLSTLAMVYVKRHATLPPDTLIGVFHALTLGLGLCLLGRGHAAVQRPPGRIRAVRQPADRHRRRPRCCSSPSASSSPSCSSASTTICCSTA